MSVPTLIDRAPRLVRGAWIAVCLFASVLPVASAQAQNASAIPALPSGIDPSLLNRGLERLSRDPTLLDRGVEGFSSNRRSLGPERRGTLGRESEPAVAPERPPAPPSVLEEEYSRRGDRRLSQIGYDVFGIRQPVSNREAGAVQDSYVLGVGDELLVHFRGKSNQSTVVGIDREGTVVLPELQPLPAAGLTFGEFRQQLRNEVQQRMLGTEAFASVARIREIAVTVAGELNSPGIVRVSGLSTLIDAIYLAGGIKKTGSLRNVQVWRQGTAIPVDLYDVVLGRSAAQFTSLADGDRIFVPVLGTTLAVAGQVKRPGIFELPAGQTEVAASELLQWAGGELVRGDYRHAVLRVGRDGAQELADVPRLAARTVRGGEILLVDPVRSATSGRVTVLGHVRQPGPKPLGTARSVRALIGGYGSLLPDPYLPFAVVERTDSRSRATIFEKVDLRAVLDGRTPQTLSSDDRLFVFGLRDIRYLTSSDVIEALSGRATSSARGCAGLGMLARWVRSNPRSDIASGQFSTAVQDLAGGQQPCPALFNDVPGLLTFAIQNAILVRGEVLNPGVYPIASQSSVDEVMSIARSLGGERRSDLRNPEGAAPNRAASTDEAADAENEVAVARQDLSTAMDLTDVGDAPTTRMSESAAAGAGYGRSGVPAGVSITPLFPSAGGTTRPDVGASGIIEVEQSRVRVLGHVRYPGSRSLESAPSLRALIGDPAVYQDNPYLLFGVIIRSDPATLLRNVVRFTPAKVMSGEADVRLQNRDVVYIFGLAEIRRLLSSPNAPRAERGVVPLNGRSAASEIQPGASEFLASPNTPTVVPGALGGSNRTIAVPPTMQSSSATPRREGTSMRSEFGGRAATDRSDAAPVAPDFLQRLLNESVIEVLGQVVVPGRYPVAGAITLEDAFLAGGGLLPGADLSEVEVTRFPLNRERNRQETHRMALDLRSVSARSVSISAGDTVMISPLISDKERLLVEIAGEVRRPGSYAIVRGEKLSSFLDRAGGLQPTAYPAGAVFMRESVRRTEASARERTAREFHRAILGRMIEPPPSSSAQAPTFTAEQLALLTSLLEQLNENEALGRMVVEVNPIVLRSRPELDITLEGGDRLFIPRMPLTVFVSGEVYNPGAQQFAVNRSIEEYIEAAGGLTDSAERSNLFVIRPNGSAQRISLSAWGSSSGQVTPGSWIVIPRDLSPFRFRDLATTLTGIISNLAVSAASLAVISSRNN